MPISRQGLAATEVMAMRDMIIVATTFGRAESITRGLLRRIRPGVALGINRGASERREQGPEQKMANDGVHVTDS